MIAFHAHFDGRVIVPDHTVDLPLDQPFIVHIDTSGEGEPALREIPALQWLADNAVVDDLPADLSAQHDYYLYGTPRRS